MTKRDLLNLWATIEALLMRGNQDAAFLSTTATYALLKNRRILKNEIEPLSGICLLTGRALPVPEMEAYEKARIAICEDLSSKDDKGKPKTVNGNYDIPVASLGTLAERLQALEAEHAEAFAAQKAKQAEVDAILGLPAPEIEFHSLALAQVPDHITSNQLEALMLIITE